ncbi:MAG: class I SAM-dependent methyltransferase [Burkholderiales bacterium]
MSNKTINLPDSLYEYVLAMTSRENDAARELREVTANHPMARMQIAPDQGQFMALIVRLMRARRTLEVGVFTGYSSLVVALALPPEGRLVACDINREWAEIGRPYWEKAKVAHKIDLRIAPALATLDELLERGEAGAFDFAFIDADKENYIGYYERALALVRAGGLIAIDNTLWSGKVADAKADDSETRAICAFNEHLRRDLRVDLSLVPIGDGLTLARKKE